MTATLYTLPIRPKLAADWDFHNKLLDNGGREGLPTAEVIDFAPRLARHLKIKAFIGQERLAREGCKC